MKILQVIPVFYPALQFGGPVKVVCDVSRSLASRGHQVTVYTTNALDHKRSFDSERKEYALYGFEVLYFRNILRPYQLYISPGMIFELQKKIKDFDIIHIHSWRGFQDMITHHYAVKYNVPYILQAHGALPRIMVRQTLKSAYDVLFGYRLLRDASKVVALSRAEAWQYRSMGVPEKKIKIIPNGIDLSEYCDLPPKGSFKKRFNLSENKKMILYLGRIHKIKGIDRLVKAYVYSVDKLGLNDALLAIAGSDDGYLGELKQSLPSTKMITDVLLTGPLYGRDKLEAYVDADVFVLPSRYETFPNVVLEAYACSKPVIASNVESISDIVIRGKTGLLFSPDDVQELAEMIVYILAHPEEAQEMGHRAHKLVEDKFSISKVADSVEALYEKILEERLVA
jgi:glycosyltransferase involved in cell wall biosynthesis